jgi:hypothetical protein
MKTLLLALALVASGALASLDKGVAGSWTMTVEGGPHGKATMGLVLAQEGTKVTGTFASGHGPDMQVVGEFKDGQLKIETPEGAETRIIFSARLQDDGTLAGYISSEVGDMKWSAVRVVEKKDGK